MSDQEPGTVPTDNRLQKSCPTEDEANISTSAPTARPNNGSAVIANEKTGLGDALRDVYQQTVQEDIPAEMLDLLNRLR